MIYVALFKEKCSAVKLGLPTFIFPPKYYVENHSDDIVIRWGATARFFNKQGEKAEFINVINSREAIKLASDKGSAIKAMSEVVNTPKIYFKHVSKGKFILRPNKHEKGQGFQLVDAPLRVPAEHYATEFLDTDTEFRVWFCGNKTISALRVSKKDGENLCRSNFGYQFLHDTPKKLHEDTIKAKNKLGLDIGAADVLYYKGDYYFTEINTAPACDHSVVVSFYKTEISNLVNQKFGAISAANFNYEI